MPPRKSERIMNLAICLLMARRFIEKTQIRQVVEGYHNLSDSAFERTFERDKDDLRAMGVPVETGSNNPLFPDEVGYRIRRKDFELPAIEFSPAEMAALGLAATVWESATQAEQTVSALAKLRAAGVDPDPARVGALSPSIGAREPAFASIWAATLDRAPVRFGYKGGTRHVEPWAMTYRRGAWYLLALDRDKAEPRVFKVARVEGPAERIGRPRSYSPPEGDLSAAWSGLDAAQADAEALVAIRPGRALEFRRRGRAIEAAEVGQAARLAPGGYDLFAVSYARGGDLVGEVCVHGIDVVVLSPQSVRDQVVAQLSAVAGRTA